MLFCSSVLNRFTKSVILTLFLSFVAGCGSADSQGEEPSATVEELAAVESQEELKRLLQSVADSGEGGSALAGVATSIETLSLEDAQKQSLQKDFEQLNSETDPAKVKSIATRMVSKL